MVRACSVLAGFAVCGAMAAVASVPANASDGSKPEFSFNLGVTTDYIFRGFSQTGRGPTGQGGVDMTWGMFYAGVWASGVDFGDVGAPSFKKVAHVEVDFYAGFKPVLGPVTFDFGVIYYAYPNARDPSVEELDYVELKAGASVSPWKGGEVSGNFFYSPEYTGKTGRVWTIEAGFSQELPAIGSVTPTFSALVGYQKGRTTDYADVFVNSLKTSYTYWNAGVEFAWEKFTFDVRYWDTNVPKAGGFCDGTPFPCDGRVVGSVKFTY